MPMLPSGEPWTWTPLKAPPLPDPPETYVPATELPSGHRQVLLKLRRGELAAVILIHMREQGIPEPNKSDWVAAIERGHVARRDGRLMLTPPGQWAAGNIMRDLARKFGVHAITHRAALGNHGPSASCTCGATWHTGSRSGLTPLGGAINRHLKEAEEAKRLGLPAPQDVRRSKFEEMLREVGEGHGR